MENIAKTLASYEKVSGFQALLQAAKDAVRMLAFLIFPAIAWEHHKKPIHRGLSVARKHKPEFATGFVLSKIAGGAIFLPVTIIIYFTTKTDLTLGNGAWFVVIIYSGFAWSLTLLIEQLYTAELYLWDLKWRSACEAAERRGEDLPSLQDISRPSVMNHQPDFLVD